MNIRIIEFPNMFKRPERKRPIGDCGYDCYAAETVTIPAHGSARINLGFGLKVPTGYTAYMHNRTGTYKRGLICSNALIDCNYRGEVGAYMINVTDEDITIERGERPASMIIVPCIDINWINEEEELMIHNQLEGLERGEARENSSGR